MATVTYKVYAIGDGEGTVTGGGPVSDGQQTTITATPAEGSTLAYYRYSSSTSANDPLKTALNYDGQAFTTTGYMIRGTPDGTVFEYAFFFAKKAKVRLTLNGYRLNAKYDLRSHGSESDATKHAVDARMDADTKDRTVEYSLMRPYSGDSGTPSGSLTVTITDEAFSRFRIDRAKTDTNMSVIFDGGSDYPSQMIFTFPLSCVDADTADYHLDLLIWHVHDGKMLYTGTDGRPVFDGQGRLLCR